MFRGAVMVAVALVGGGIARAASETAGTPYAGVVIVAGAGGDRPQGVRVS